MNDDTPAAGEEVDSTEGAVVIDPATMTESQLREHHAALSAQLDELTAQPQTVATAHAMNDLRVQRNEVVEAVNTILTTEPVADASFADPIPEVTTPDTTTPDTTTPDTTTQEATVSDTAEGPIEGADEAVAAAEAILSEGAGQLAMTASAGRPTAPTVPEKVQMAYTAGAGQRVYSQGTELSWDSLARAWDSAGKKLRPGADGEEVSAIVANLGAFEDVKDQLGVELLTDTNSAKRNDELIQDSLDAWRMKRSGVDMPAHVAAICTPLDIIREIPICGETDTRFTDIFPQRPIGRLGFTFTRGSSAAAVNGAINLIDIAAFETQLNEDNATTWKPCIPITCATPVTVTAEELVTCVSVQISTEMSSPERVREFMHKVQVQRARRREQKQLTMFDETASGYNFTAHNGYGTLPSLVEAVETLMPQLAYAERLDETDWDIVFEPGFVNKLTIDRHNVGNPVELAAARAETEAWLRTYLGRPLVFLRDFKGASPFQAIPTVNTEVNMAALPATDRIRLVPSGAYIYGSTGEEATGWQTDPQLVRQNRKQAFTAEHFLLAKHGCHPAAYIDLTSTPSGGRAGLVTPFGFVVGGS